MTRTMSENHQVPFRTRVRHGRSYASDVGTGATARRPVAITNPLTRIIPSLSPGKLTSLSRNKVATSVSSSTFEATEAQRLPLTLSTPAPSVAILTTEQRTARETELHSVLYKHVSPHIPSSWDSALHSAKLDHEFPLLVHHLTYGSPIGNPPPLISMFIPKNLPSATLLPEVISNEIAAKLSTGRISGPFTPEEAHFIFDGHFHTSPLGLVEKVLELPGDEKWRMICHLSKTDTEGTSTNGWLSSDDFPTRYYSASMTADFVSAFPFVLPRVPCHGLVPLQCEPCHGLVFPLPCMPCHGLSCAVMRTLPWAIYAATRALPWASLRCRCAPCHGLVHQHTRLQFSVPSCTFHSLVSLLPVILVQVSSCPVGTQAATLDIVQAYRCSPIAPLHKKYLAFHWNDGIFVQHNVIEGLAPAGGIQGAPADACIAILAHHGISPIFKWVDNFIVFHLPRPLTSVTSNEISYLGHDTSPGTNR